MREDIIRRRGYDPAINGGELSLRIASNLLTARYLATRLQREGDIACELCCGVGVSLVELSRSFRKVIGVEIDPQIIEDCRKNLERAGVRNYELLCGDVRDRLLLGRIKADVVLYDVPYWSSHAGQVDPNSQNPNLASLVAAIRELITDRIVIYTPIAMTYGDIVSAVGSCEFVKAYIDGRHDKNFVFLGTLAKQIGENRIDF